MKLTHRVDKSDTEGGALFQYVDWKNTYAYSLGFGSIYLNMKGREEDGIVEAGEGAATVLENMSKQLLALTDTVKGERAVKNVYRNDIYSGKELEKSPDLVVGFEEGYRASWQTALGGTPYYVFDDNLNKWSGDHIVDPSIVPGILFSNLKIDNSSPGLIDLAPTILSCFGMSTPTMQGRTMLL